MPNLKISNEAEARAQHQDLVELEQQEERNSKNPEFVQMVVANMTPQRLLARRAPAAFQIMLFMAQKMNKQNAISCSQKTLAKLTNYSLPTIKKAIRLLEKEKWIQTIRIGTSNAYLVNSNIYWKSTREGRFATFHATIIADREEQEINFEEIAKLKNFPFVMPNEQVVLVGNEEEQKELDL